MCRFIIVGLLVAGCFIATAETNKPARKSSAELMHEMRFKQLTTPPVAFGEKPTPEFPRVRAVVMDWPIEGATVTVVARTTGDASIYTTGTFGVFGGIGHDSVRSAAMSCVKVAHKHYEGATPTKDYPYPKGHRVRYYLVGYDEVRVIDGDLKSARTGKWAGLYEAAQRVVTELRLITQQQKGDKR
jgi:hypothetical protein